MTAGIAATHALSASSSALGRHHLVLHHGRFTSRILSCALTTTVGRIILSAYFDADHMNYFVYHTDDGRAVVVDHRLMQPA
jgi:hypothetical protein